MENVKIDSDSLPTKENNFMIKTKYGIKLKEIKKFIIENHKDKFVSLNLFYDSTTDNIEILGSEKKSDKLYLEFINEMEKSEYRKLFNFE